jgi:hypothetical protein
MSCSICSYTSSWLKEYTKHPIGSGASMGDYALTLVLGLILLYGVYKIVEDVRS